MEVTVQQIADMLGASIEGDPAMVITAPARIEEGVPGTLTFLALDKYEAQIYTSQASAALVSRDFAPSKPLQMTLIRVPDVYVALQQLMAWYEDQQNAQIDYTATNTSRASTHEDADIAEDAYIGPQCIIEPGASIGSGSRLIGQVYIGHGARVGAHTVLEPGVRVMKNCIIGDQCYLSANVVIGADGFGYSYDDGYQKIPQLGIVRIEDRVEIGAGSTIDRAVMGETIIKRGTIIDNLVHVGHNVVIHEHTAIAAQTGIAGSAKIGKHCRIGGQVGVAGHIQIADGTEVQAKSGLMKNSRPGDRLFGYPAIEYHNYLRSFAVFKQLPDLAKEVQQLKQVIAKLKREQDPDKA